MMQQQNRRNDAVRGALLLLLFTLAPVAHASQTNGVIDSAHKYAWGTVAGWVNFAPTNGGLTITDSAVTGYAWGANTGWIHFNATNGGVTNTAAGVLGGYAWDPGGGWVSFTGVTIDSSGKFHGTATGGSVNGASYALNFDCANCDIRTDWRPASARTTTTTITSSSIGNGAISPITITTVSITSSASTSPVASLALPSPSAPGVFGNKTPHTESPASTTTAPFENTVFKNTAASSTAHATTTAPAKSPSFFSFFNFMIFVGVVALFGGMQASFRFFARFRRR